MVDVASEAQVALPLEFRVNGKPLKLDDLIPAGSGWRINRPLQMNNLGQVLVSARHGDDDSNFSYLLLTPLYPDATPVPEPAAWLVFGLAAVGVAVARSRGKI